MPVNTGWVGGSWTDPDSGEEGFYRVYYDNSGPADPSQPIRNKPGSSFAFECHNPGAAFRVQVWRPTAQDFTTVRAPKGDTTLTANQLAQFGIVTRGDVRVGTLPD